MRSLDFMYYQQVKKVYLAFSDITITSDINAGYLIKHQFPSPGYTIMANDIGCLIIAKNFEIAMIRRQPAVQHLDDLNFIVGHFDVARGFLAPVSGIAVYVDLHEQPPISPL